MPVDQFLLDLIKIMLVIKNKIYKIEAGDLSTLQSQTRETETVYAVGPTFSRIQYYTSGRRVWDMRCDG